LHDASEAYLNDITRPVKAKLPTYKEIESVLQTAIYEKYMGGCSGEELAAMKEIDDDMLSFELHHLLGETVDERYKSVKTPITFDLVPMDAIEQRYREAFERLRSEI